MDFRIELSVFFSWQAGASGKLLHREPDSGPATSRVRLGSRRRSPSALRHGAVRRPGPQPHQQRHVTLALVPRHRPASRPRDGRRPLRRQRQGTQPLISAARLHFTIRCPTFRYTPLHFSPLSIVCFKLTWQYRLHWLTSFEWIQMTSACHLHFYGTGISAKSIINTLFLSP